jgi:nucleoid-associated protein YgaU
MQQSKQQARHKKLVEAELAAWHLVADTGPIRAIGRSARTKAIAVISFVAALAIGLTVFGSYVDRSSTAAAPAQAVSHAPRHRASPRPVHTAKPVTAPGTHLRKHARDYVTVRAGDSLWGIAQRYLVPANATPAQTAEAVQALELKNHLTNASVLEVGQRVHL